ncbi:unnamed protein product [Urochloa humidicola]
MEEELKNLIDENWLCKIFNIPDHARNVDVVTLIAELARDVIAVDEVSLIKQDPVRVKLQAREIAKLRGYIEFFTGGVGYEVQFMPELPEKRTQPLAPSQKPDEGFSDGDEEDELLDSDDENGNRSTRERGPRRNKKHKHSDDSGKGGQAPSVGYGYY